MDRPERIDARPEGPGWVLPVKAGERSERRGGRFCLNGVTGPDEYTTVVDNNAYTNLMARENLEGAARVIDWLAGQDCDAHAALLRRTGVTEEEVTSMNRRMAMGGDTSLNAPLKDSEGESQWQDFLVDNGPLQDELIAEDEEAKVRHDLLVDAMDSLNDREKHILTERRLADDPQTLEELSQVYGVSRERIRQIEVRAFEKLQAALIRLATDKKLLTAA